MSDRRRNEVLAEKKTVQSKFIPILSNFGAQFYLRNSLKKIK